MTTKALSVWAVSGIEKYRVRMYWWAIVLGAVPSIFAQSAGTGALTGTVTDPTGSVVPNTSVTLTSTETNQTRNTTTGTDGG